MLSLFKPNVKVFLNIEDGDSFKKVTRRTKVEICNIMDNIRKYKKFDLIKEDRLTRPMTIIVTDKGRLVQGILREIVEMIV